MKKVSKEYIEKIQKQLKETSNDPSMTLVLVHHFDFEWDEHGKAKIVLGKNSKMKKEEKLTLENIDSEFYFDPKTEGTYILKVRQRGMIYTGNYLTVSTIVGPNSSERSLKEFLSRSAKKYFPEYYVRSKEDPSFTVENALAEEINKALNLLDLSQTDILKSALLLALYSICDRFAKASAEFFNNNMSDYLGIENIEKYIEDSKKTEKDFLDL